ncbi:MAG: APC family permease [Pseudomonadota bacterium]
MTRGAENKLARRLGLGLFVFYGVGVMVGAGIYVLIGEVAARVGPWAPIAFLLAGATAAFTAASFAELSCRLPESAGEAAYVREAFGRLWLATVVGLAVAAVGVISAGAVLQGGVGYLMALLPLPKFVLIVGVGLLLGIVSALGVEKALGFAAIITAIEVLGLLIVSFVATTSELPAPVQPEFDALPVVALSGAAFLAFFAFLGFEDMVNMAEEVKSPLRNLPRGIFIALAVTVIIYVLVAWAVTRIVSAAELGASDRPLALVFERATGGGSWSIEAIAVMAAVNGVIAQIVMASRVIYGLGRRVAFLAYFKSTNPVTRTPVRATAVITAFVILLALGAPVATLAAISAFILLVIFAAMNLALLRLKQLSPAPENGFVAPVWAPWAGFVSALAMCMAELLRLAA